MTALEGTSARCRYPQADPLTPGEDPATRPPTPPRLLPAGTGLRRGRRGASPGRGTRVAFLWGKLPGRSPFRGFSRSQSTARGGWGGVSIYCLFIRLKAGRSVPGWREGARAPSPSTEPSSPAPSAVRRSPDAVFSPFARPGDAF